MSVFKNFFAMFFLVYFVLVASLLCGCDTPTPADHQFEVSPGGKTSNIEGVIFSKFADNKGSIKNTTDRPVRIKFVIAYSYKEVTQWIKKINPGETIAANHGGDYIFYILTNEGGEIGFIRSNHFGG